MQKCCQSILSSQQHPYALSLDASRKTVMNSWIKQGPRNGAPQISRPSGRLGFFCQWTQRKHWRSKCGHYYRAVWRYREKKVFFTVIVGDYAMFRLQVQILRRYDFVIMMLIWNMPGDLEGSKWVKFFKSDCLRSLRHLIIQVSSSKASHKIVSNAPIFLFFIFGHPFLFDRSITR